MNLRQIEAFRRIMMTGSVTRAAQAMRVSQPAVSRLLADLERSTELQLFERQAGRLRATRDAEKLFEEVERSFSGLDRIASRAREIREWRHARLRLAAMPALCLEVVPRVLERLLGQNPDVSVALQARSSAQVVNWIGAGQFDLGLAGPPPDAAGVETLAVVSAPCLVALSHDHPLARLDVLSASDLSDTRLITATTEQSSRLDFDRTALEAGLRSDVQIETPLGFVACRLARCGLGAAIVDPFSARIDAGLTFLPLKPEVLFTFALIRSSARPISREDRAFSLELCAFLQELDLPGLKIERASEFAVT